jgi:hypothetical protein
MKINKLVPIVCNRKTLSILVSLTLLISFGCRSKTVVKRLSTVDSKTETKSLKGSLYHLPLTVVKISVPLKMDKQTPGKFSDFAPCFFDEDEADQRVKVEKKEVSIDKPSFDSAGVADFDETFVVQTTGRYFESRTVAMTLNKEGNLTEGKIETKDETLPIAIKIAETGIGLATKILTQGLSEGGQDFGAGKLEKLIEQLGTPENNNCYIQGFRFQHQKISEKSAEVQQKIDKLNSELTAARNSNDKAKTEQLKKTIGDLEKTKGKLDDEAEVWRKKATEAEQAWQKVIDTTDKTKRSYLPFVVNFRTAKKAKERLDDLTLSRQSLQAELTNIDPEIYKARLKELNDEIKSLSDAFGGKKETLAWTGNFEFNPSKKKNGKDEKTLFTYSKSAGICSNSPFNDGMVEDGVLVAEDFQAKCDAQKDELVKVQIYADRQDTDKNFIAQVEKAKEEMKNVTSGWYFRIPAKATIALIECKGADNARCSADITEYGRQKMMVAQYGAVVSLPAKTAGRSSTSSITLDETTGALKNFSVSTSPLLDKSTIDEAGKTAEKVIDASDPLNQKKRELDLLKTQNEINTERKKLEAPSPTPSPSPTP